MTDDQLPLRARVALAGAAAVDSIAAVLRARRPVHSNYQGRTVWPDASGPHGDEMVWMASTSSVVAHRFDDPLACPASVARRGGYTMPAGSAEEWFRVSWCPRCWPGLP
ncbi:hypothetical protein ACGFKZ_30090 [Micromonospora tulbaghiae]|uniref:hypothetical protein n=1 Tax=Micromonospora tulbaghiae TaxID=479978 RepID=UPI00371EFEC6